MIVIVIVVLVVLVVVAIVWARFSAVRSESRSVETYEHALDVLGEVSKRTESTGFRILPHDETGRPHVGRPTDEGGGQVPPPAKASGRPTGQAPLASPRLPPAGPPKLRFSNPRRPGERPPGADQRSDGKQRDDGAPGAPAGAGMPAAHLRPPSVRRRVPTSAAARAGEYQSAAHRRRQVMARRAATGGAAAVAVVAIVLAAIELTGGGSNRPRSKVTTTTVHHGGSGSTTTTTTTTATTTTVPATLKPTLVTASVVSFTAPSGQYTLGFEATGGACWIGIKQSTVGPWLFAETLNAGQSATYHASGALVVTLGAPAFIGLRVTGSSRSCRAA